MAGFKISPATTPTRRGIQPKKDPLGSFLSFKSSRVSLLKRQSSEGSRFQTTSISKHYELNHQVYEAFRIHYYNLSSVVDTGDSNNSSNSNNNNKKNAAQQNANQTAQSNFQHISNAFCLGWSFVETALLELPTHGYFYSRDGKIVELRKRSSLVALEVTRLLQRILKLMDSMALETNNNNKTNRVVLDSSSIGDDSNALWLLEDNRENCKRKLSALKRLAKEQQCEHLDPETYESKRSSVLSQWSKTNCPRDPEGRYGPIANNNNNNNKTFAVVGNHRAFSKKEREPAAGATVVLDCETVGESFLSCSRILCPTAIPDAKPQDHDDDDDDNNNNNNRPLSLLEVPKDASHKSLADEVTANNDDSDSDSGSDCAVWDGQTARGPIQHHKSENAVVFARPTTKSNTTRMAISERQGVPSPDRSTSSSTSSRTGKGRRIPNIKKRQSKNKTADKKKGASRYTTRLFGKKSHNSQHHHHHQQQQQQREQQRRHHEDAEFQEALYQSELEAAKAASMRDEETKSMISQCYSEYSSGSSGIHPSDYTVDFDLQQALYLSELEAACRQSFDANRDEEKRDDSGGDGRNEEVVTATVVPTHRVVVKGVPVKQGPPGAIYRCRNDPYDSLNVVKACCRKDFERLREQGKVVVSRISTYQGRVQGSTNGCTVIAPLLCAHYFKTQAKDETSPLIRLSDERITSIIDSECPSLLPDIRKSLGVSKNAFLIPHDAHEHLIESKHMSRDQFVTVCGGNILEEGHLGALVRELSTVLPDGKKLGATFFFHQHVIAILQLRKPGTQNDKDTLSFDIIDSLPNKETLPPPLPPALTDKLLPQAPSCARIFCKDALSLKATLKWYACSVFTPENERYIDDYHWDEKLTDFDPRVFQAFVWKEI